MTSAVSLVSRRAAQRLATLDPGGTVFAEFTALANANKAINLGQGFPSLPLPAPIQAAVAKIPAMPALAHQYARSEGHPALTSALSTFFEPRLHRALDAQTEIGISVGACEAIFSVIFAFIDPGDEVLLIQPYYDAYPAAVRLSGGVPRFARLQAPVGQDASTAADWTLSMDQLERLVTPKTKMLVLNNPNNPVGKVYTRAELELIAAFVTKHDLLVLADEVYETLVYADAPSPMIKFASLPGMFDRTLTVGSLGKTFSVTGWKIGWVLGAPAMVKAWWLVHQFTSFCVAAPLQIAAADAFRAVEGTDHFETNARRFQALRDQLVAVLRDVGLRPCVPHGSYFIMSEASRIPVMTREESPLITRDGRETRVDYLRARWLSHHAQVTPIPPSPFYEHPNPESDAFVRFAFCKEPTDLEEAGKRLRACLLK
ncbi:hypothetical protein CXG81DRAFT_25551 [Caulochytrium protostelioides]|uniref:Aminotransferase class I/classII large domain-containing protein n=1 Tax=Caulochytrium protostelioides TaxID=1555241 RepID=A0A4P9X9L9_9FUNG|nr:hypothetical protein CXG81DRAFT_25551 [Caulochytrium protostelioides]|eukprot:RKP01780.1 hypothetical protein CXG81DRAFT_25551 [Caulochytrium protostelioides]